MVKEACRTYVIFWATNGTSFKERSPEGRSLLNIYTNMFGTTAPHDNYLFAISQIVLRKLSTTIAVGECVECMHDRKGPKNKLADT